MDERTSRNAYQSSDKPCQLQSNLIEMDWIAQCSLAEIEAHRADVLPLLSEYRRALGASDPFFGLDFSADSTILLLRALDRVLALVRQRQTADVLPPPVGVERKPTLARSMVRLG